DLFSKQNAWLDLKRVRRKRHAQSAENEVRLPFTAPVVVGFLPLKLAPTLFLLACHVAAAVETKLTPTDETTEAGFVEITGVEAGAFNPAIWQAGTLNLLPDIRSPLVEPQPGKFRNIYAPSVVETSGGWRMFYGAWDGVPSGNDRIYSLLTK